MKKIKTLLVAAMMLVLCLAFTACGNEEAVEGPEVPETAEVGVVEVYVVGEAVEGGIAYEDLADSMTHKEVDGTFYYGATAEALTADVEAAGVFFEAADGFITYAPAEEALLTLYVTDEEGAYQPLEFEGKQCYGGYTGPEGIFSTGVSKVYITTTACDWEIDVQVDGKSVGALTMADFMKKTPVGEAKVPTAMYDAKFMYKQGAATYEGAFLGIDLETMVAKLNALEMEVPAEYTNVELTGVSGMGKEGLNAEYNTDPNSPWYIGNVKFFAMYDGKTYCPIAKQNVGLTAFIDGQGLRWMTYSLETINFVTK